MNPATQACVRMPICSAIATAPTPRSTNTVVKPAKNGSVPRMTRIAVPGVPRCEASTAVTAER